MTTETLREAVARAICRAGGLCVGFCHAQRCATARKLHGDAADSAIRTVLERLREPGDDVLEVGQNVCNAAYLEPDEVPADAYFVWQAMLDAAVREVG